MRYIFSLIIGDTDTIPFIDSRKARAANRLKAQLSSPANREYTMNINQIKYFVSVFEQHSFSLAAQEQCVTVQAVSKAIGDLERDFDDKLFARSNHGADPTPLGMDFYLRARPVLDAFEGLEAFARGEEPPKTQPISFNVALVSPSFSNNEALRQAFSAFITKNTNFEVELSIVSPATAQHDLEAGEYDALITIGKYENPKTNCVVVGTLPTGIIVAKTHPLAHNKMVTIQEIGRYPAGMSPICDTFNESILQTYRKRGLLGEVRTVETLAEQDMTFMVDEQGFFFSALFPTPKQDTTDFTMIPVNPAEQIDIPICSVSLKEGSSPQFRFIEDFLIKTISSSLR